jgi:serine/threonine protein kinase
MVAQGRIVLLDLGIARTYSSDALRDTVRYGTPGYAPPEQFGYGQTSARSDLYSLGMTLSFCLTGEEPTQQLRESGFLDGRIPPAMREVLVKATQFDPALRYASARELKEGLVRAAEGHPRPVADPSRPQQQEPGTDSRRKGPPALLGKIWNAVVIVVWAVLLLALSRGIFNPVDSLKDAPRWLLVVMYLGAFAIPFTAVGYLLLDKRRLRAREPFSRHTWKQELPFCLGVAAVSFLIALLVAAFGYPRP